MHGVTNGCLPIPCHFQPLSSLNIFPYDFERVKNLFWACPDSGSVNELVLVHEMGIPRPIFQNKAQWNEISFIEAQWVFQLALVLKNYLHEISVCTQWLRSNSAYLMQHLHLHRYKTKH